MSDRWSTPEDEKLLKMWCLYDPPLTTREIADELNRSKSSVHRRIKALGLVGYKGDRAHYEEVTGISVEPLIKAVRVEPLPVPKTHARGPDYTVIAWGDVHFPFQDDRALDILYQITSELDVFKLVCLGDIFDFFEISDYRAPKYTEPNMQKTLNQGVQHLATMRTLSGALECHFMGGNHEDRWDRMLDKARKDVRFRQLLKLSKVKRALDFEEITGFEDLGYTYHPYMEGRPHVEKDLLLFTHGDHTNKYMARSTMEKYGKSVVFGHMHRIQNYTKRDLKGQESGWCVGCLSTLDPHYDIFADWHQGFAVVTFTKAPSGWLYNVEQVRIHDGQALFRDKLYIAS